MMASLFQGAINTHQYRLGVRAPSAAIVIAVLADQHRRADRLDREGAVGFWYGSTIAEGVDGEVDGVGGVDCLASVNKAKMTASSPWR